MLGFFVPPPFLSFSTEPYCLLHFSKHWTRIWPLHAHKNPSLRALVTPGSRMRLLFKSCEVEASD